MAFISRPSMCAHYSPLPSFLTCFSDIRVREAPSSTSFSTLAPSNRLFSFPRRRSLPPPPVYIPSPISLHGSAILTEWPSSSSWSPAPPPLFSFSQAIKIHLPLSNQGSSLGARSATAVHRPRLRSFGRSVRGAVCNRLLSSAPSFHSRLLSPLLLSSPVARPKPCEGRRREEKEEGEEKEGEGRPLLSLSSFSFFSLLFFGGGMERCRRKKKEMEKAQGKELFFAKFCFVGKQQPWSPLLSDTFGGNGGNSHARKRGRFLLWRKVLTYCCSSISFFGLSPSLGGGTLYLLLELFWGETMILPVPAYFLESYFPLWQEGKCL